MSLGWNYILPSGGQAPTLTGVPYVSLVRGLAGQNFTFVMINAANDLPLTGATIVGFVSLDGGAQASLGGIVTEVTPTGNGVYNYAPTAAETQASAASFLMTATGGVPENIMFLTAGGLHRNVAGQHVTFGLFTTSGAADVSATPSVLTSKDGSALVTGGGTVTNLNHGQYDYAPTALETNGKNVSFTFSATGDVIQNISIFTVIP